MKKEIKNAVQFQDITMVFPGIKALDKVNMEIRKGEIHAIIGENGAGKSTLMSILFGLYKATNGIIKINGSEREIKNPNHATDLGIGMVHQHFKIVDIYSNLDNIILGNETSRYGFIYKREARRKIQGIQKEFNLDFKLRNKTGKESVGVQQKVEIMKMLYKDADILVFDEPTAVLTPQEITGLLKTMKDFKKKGKTILFISHKLNEVKEVADRATIIRKGKVIKTVEVKKTSIVKMAEMMVGSKVVSIKNNQKSKKSSQPLLKLEKVNSSIGDKKIKDLSLEVFGGEIHAIAGIEGNGQRVLEEVISGIHKHAKGKILFFDKKKKKLDNITKGSVQKRTLAGLSYIPGDRHKYAMFLDYKLSDNMIQRWLESRLFSFMTFISGKKRDKFYLNVEKKYDVRGGRNGASFARSLSGGNQQKAVVGREMESPHDILLVVQPTRGLDVGAINNIHKKILSERKNGKAILLISFELDEVLSLADKISVISEGKILSTMEAKNASRNEIGLLMAGITKKGNK